METATQEAKILTVEGFKKAAASLEVVIPRDVVTSCITIRPPISNESQFTCELPAVPVWAIW